MGYTHYFKRKDNVSVNEWNRIVSDFKEVIEKAPATSSSAGAHYSDEPLDIQGDRHETCKPIIDNRVVLFNGVGDFGHETFYFARVIEAEVEGFCFCKTARKPYDYFVCAFLILLNYYSKTTQVISSDGHAHDWQPVLEDLRRILKNKDLKLPDGIDNFK